MRGGGGLLPVIHASVIIMCSSFPFAHTDRNVQCVYVCARLVSACM